jgi:hypothetical protein
MEKFVKNKIDKVKMQPLPQTWGKIEVVLQQDKKAAFVKRGIVFIVFLLVIGGSGFWLASQFTTSTALSQNEILSTNKNEEKQSVENASEVLTKEDLIEVTPEGIDKESSMISVVSPDIENRVAIVDRYFGAVYSKGRGEARKVREYDLDRDKVQKLKMKSPTTQVKEQSLAKIIDEQEALDTIWKSTDTMIYETTIPKMAKFFIEPSVGFASTFYKNEFDDFLLAEARAGIGRNAQIVAGYNYRSRWSFRLGLKLSEYNWTSTVGDALGLGYDSLSNKPQYFTGEENIQPATQVYQTNQNTTTNNNLRYISIPLCVDFKIMDRRLKLGIGLGLSADWLLSSDVVEYYPEVNTFVRLNESATATKQSVMSSAIVTAGAHDVFKKFNLSYTTHLFAEYGLSGNWSVVSSPYYSRQVRPFMSTSSSVRRAYAFGLQVGIKYKL